MSESYTAPITDAECTDPDVSSLSADATAWYEYTRSKWTLSPHHDRLLLLCAQSWDEWHAAQAAVTKNGLTYEDRFGAPRLRPEVAVVRDARVAFSRLLKQLDLDPIDQYPIKSLSTTDEDSDNTWSKWDREK